MWDKNTRKIHPIKFGNKIYIPPTCYIIHILDKKEILTILEKIRVLEDILQIFHIV